MLFRSAKDPANDKLAVTTSDGKVTTVTSGTATEITLPSSFLDSEHSTETVTVTVENKDGKICTDEEVVRLKSHVVHMKETLQSDEAGIGRKLDFIAQEMNREANTILSKANDLEVSNTGIGLKTEIEKVREQIQNIE